MLVIALLYSSHSSKYRVRHGYGCFLNGCYGAGRVGRGLGRGQLNSSGHATSVDVMPQWTLEHRVFVYDSFVKSGGSLIETQQLFRCRFNNGRHGNIPIRNTILRWLTSFRARGTIRKKKPPGPVATARTPENVERVREAVVESNPFCSATCYRIGNEQKHGKANRTQRFGIPSLQSDDRSDVKRRGLSTTFSLRRANARNYRRT